MSIDVKMTMSDFNLGLVEKWSIEDLEFLIQNGAYINKVDYVHIPLDKISGQVPFGRADKSKPDLQVGNRKLKVGKKRSTLTQIRL